MAWPGPLNGPVPSIDALDQTSSTEGFRSSPFEEGLLHHLTCAA